MIKIKNKNFIETKPYPYNREELKAIETKKKPFLPTAAMLKSIELQLELKKHTLEEVARECGISKMTLFRWRKDPDYQNLYLKRSWEVLKEFTPIANKSLMIAILKQDVAALKLFYTLTENIQEELRVTFGWGDDKK